MRKLLVLVVAIGTLAVSTSNAFAYSHSWGRAYWPSDTRLYDDAGNVYNPWTAVVTTSNTQLPEICGKAVTQAGNLKSTSSHYCSYNTTGNNMSLNSASPTSNAYVYWNGSTSYQAKLDGYATTG